MKYILGLFLLIATLPGAAPAPALVVIAHKDVTDSGLPASDIQDVYLGKKTKWKDNTDLKPAQLKDSAAMDEFLKIYVKRSKRLYQNHWNKMIFTGQGVPPKLFENEKDLLDYVATTKGALGYVTRGADTKNVKVIEIK
jgi:ABC-type phosphate transport system substrate-binding protein